MKIIMPEKVSFIIDRLKSQGFDAYAVGGCVRDSLLGREPHDWDITTDAKPLDVKKIFKKTIDTGIQHGTVTVMLDHEGFEVTTYRIDGEYSDGRHPDEVSFTSELFEDLRRRDFTINAMAYNDEAGVVDLFGGVEDLGAGIIRCVGSPDERFGEDALRMLRALRFAAQLGFTIEDETYKSIQRLNTTIEKVSAERIQVELVKLLTSDHPELMREFYLSGIADVVLPEFSRLFETQQNNPHHCYSVGEHTVHAMQGSCPDKVIRLAMLFHDIAKPQTCTADEKGIDHFYKHPEVGSDMAKAIMKRLKFDNDTISAVCRLVKFHDYRPVMTLKGVRRAVFHCGEEAFPVLFEVKRADTLAQSMYQRQEKLQYIDEFETLYNRIIEEGHCLKLSDLKLGGKDLMAMGIKAGPLLGQILKELLEIVLDDPELNNEEDLKAFVKEKYLDGYA